MRESALRLMAIRQAGLEPLALSASGRERMIHGWAVASEDKRIVFSDSSLISTIPELPGPGWLAAEPEATPQTHRLRPWGFPTVSPSHPSVSPHHGIQRITVEFSEKSRFFRSDRPVWCHTERKGPLIEIGPHSVFVNPVVGV